MNTIRPSARDAIVEAAFQTFNRRPGASLGDVARNAGVGRATLHRYFRSRDVLMIELARIATAELNTAVEQAVTDATSHTDGLQRALTAIIPLAERQWFLAHEQVDQDQSIAAAYEQERQALRASIDAAKGEGTFDAAVSTKWIATVFDNLIYSAWTMVRDDEATASQAADMAWRTLIHGVGVAG